MSWKKVTGQTSFADCFRAENKFLFPTVDSGENEKSTTHVMLQLVDAFKRDGSRRRQRCVISSETHLFLP